MKILLEYYKGEVEPRVSIDGEGYTILETKSGLIESDSDKLPLKYTEYELKLSKI